ncbi:MAG: O-antigen ligase family protein, partial [Chitinophagaceae bacterium]
MKHKPLNYIRVFTSSIPLLICTGCLITAVVFQSRSFVLGYTVSLAFVLLSWKKFRLHKKAAIVTGISFLLLLLFLIVCIKTDSSRGRMLIYKLSFKILKDNFWSGTGLGKFDITYSNYQAEYFKSGNYSTKELLLADSTKYAFNDYLQFVTETGIMGFVLLLIMVLIIFRLIKNAFKDREVYPPQLIIAVTQLISIAVAAFFNYVFSRPL